MTPTKRTLTAFLLIGPPPIITGLAIDLGAGSGLTACMIVVVIISVLVGIGVLAEG